MKQSLGEFLGASAGTRLCNSLIGQVIWHVSVALEKVLGKAAQAGQALTVSQHVTFTWLSSCLAYDENMEAAVATYQQQCVEACFQNPQVFMVADKATVNGLPQQFTIVTLPSNLVMMAVPRALHANYEFQHPYMQTMCSSILSCNL